MGLFLAKLVKTFHGFQNGLQPNRILMLGLDAAGMAISFLKLVYFIN